MKVLVADKLEKSALDGLKEIGCEVVSDPDLQGMAIHERLVETDAKILVVRGTKVPREAMRGTGVALIIRAGAGYNTIDVDAATEHGIKVANCPGKNGIAVAELAFGLILSLDRQIPDNVAQLRDGKWNKKGFSKAKGLYGCTLGLIGFGNIGQEMVKRAQAFGMSVIVFSGYLSDSEAEGLGVTKARSLEDLAQKSDIVSVHVSLRSETKGLLDKRFFEAMKQGAYFVNTSRAEVVVQQDLIESVNSGKIRAGLDVFDDEPTVGEGAFTGAIKDVAGAYCTHHIGAGTDQAQEAVAAETVRIVRVYMSSGEVPNLVNAVTHA